MKATGITVRRGRRTTLHAVDFNARPGELTVIVGPNGSGKTTLLQALTGDIPHGGAVSLNGRDTARMTPWDLAAIRAVLPQAAHLAFPFTVIEVVRLGLAAGLAAGRDDVPLRALERVDLAGYANRFYQELSGGEQQRAQLARVLTQVWDPVADGAPHWLFLDEPVSSLDIGHQLSVMKLARDFARAVTEKDDPLALWAFFADALKDHPRRNNRFALAGALNARFPGIGPFWFNGGKVDVPHLPRRGRARGGHGMAERRLCEARAKGTFTCWQMGGAGAVGGQVMTGIALLERLRKKIPGKIGVWPFDLTDQPIAFVEVWPSLLAEAVAAEGDPIKDRAQVRLLARALSHLPADALRDMLTVDAPDEGWILGLGYEEALKEALC